MSLVGFRAQNHPQQAPKPAVDDCGTTAEVFAPLQERFKFTIDVAAAVHNAKLPRFFTIEDDGLTQPWAGERVWCNPPFSNIRPWVEKAWHETLAGPVVMLLPANRTEQGWWQDLVEPYRQPGLLEVEFLRGRMRFVRPSAVIGPK
jgi:phage N-6-adenine-methyltransferase